MAKEFPGLKIANRGIGGDVSRGLLFRFKEDVLDLNPRAIVICIGTNDLSAHGDPAAAESNLIEILKQARAYSATVPIVISTTLPRDMAEAPMKPGAEADLKARTLKLGNGDKNIVVVDAFPAMSTPDGKPVPEYFAKDRLHVAEPGYAQWATVLRPALESLGVK
jgi:Lysophospholipase L1 and related esterases